MNSSLIETLEASGTISIDSPELSNSASIELRIKKPDSIYVKIEGPFGVSVASALITRKDFIYYNAQENNVITGPTNDINIGAILRIKVSFDELLSSFSGSFLFSDESGDSINALIENENFVITEKENVLRRKYLIEPLTYSLNTYFVFDDKNKKLLEVNYSRYNLESCGNGSVNFPNKIKITKPDKNQIVWLDYDSKELNKKNLSFRFKVPKSAKVIRWE